MAWCAFNVNDRVRVRLTDAGRAELRRQHDRATVGIGPVTYVATREVDGWSEWTMWDLIQRLGPGLVPGTWGEALPFETEMRVEVRG